MEGWIKFYRKTFDNPLIMKDSEHFILWMYLLANATHKETSAIFNNKRINLKPGQLITGRKIISSILSINESKVQRILKTFENRTAN